MAPPNVVSYANLCVGIISWLLSLTLAINVLRSMATTKSSSRQLLMRLVLCMACCDWLWTTCILCGLFPLALNVSNNSQVFSSTMCVTVGVINTFFSVGTASCSGAISAVLLLLLCGVKSKQMTSRRVQAAVFALLLLVSVVCAFSPLGLGMYGRVELLHQLCWITGYHGESDRSKATDRLFFWAPCLFSLVLSMATLVTACIKLPKRNNKVPNHLLNIGYFVFSFCLIWMGPCVREIFQFNDPLWELDWLKTEVEFAFAFEGTVNFVVWHFLTKSALLIKPTKAPKSLIEADLAEDDVSSSLINTHTNMYPNNIRGSKMTSSQPVTRGGGSMYSVVLDSDEDESDEQQYGSY